MILFFDVETTGLPSNYKASYKAVNNWPRIVQIAWLIADSTGTIIKESDSIIKPEGFTIPLDVSKIHGITNEIAIEKGKDLSNILKEFLDDVKSINLLVCHNLNYDFPILQCELYRMKLDTKINQPKFCTMLESTDYCQLPGYYGYKWPKLEELYYECFNKNMKGAHNALADVRATYECYFHLEKEGVF